MNIITSAAKAILDELMILTEHGYTFEVKNGSEYRYPNKYVIKVQSVRNTDVSVVFNNSDILLDIKYILTIDKYETIEHSYNYPLADPACAVDIRNQIIAAEVLHLKQIAQLASARAHALMNEMKAI